MGVDGPLVVTTTFRLPPEELRWRFSRSSGPGGQGVNTADSRVELRWSPDSSTALSRLPPGVQDRLRSRLSGSLVHGAVVVVAAEHRAQLRNRQAARERLADMLRQALAAPPRPRRATRPTRGSVRRRLEDKSARSRLKAQRRQGPFS